MINFYDNHLPLPRV